MFVVTAEEMREMDRLTIHKHGVPSLTLMERAGESISAAILENYSAAAKNGVLIVAGKGNNGGDGFVVAPRAADYGCVNPAVQGPGAGKCIDGSGFGTGRR